MYERLSRFDTVKARVSLREYAGDVLERAHGGLVCPVCHSGMGPKGTPAFSITPDGARWHCFSCGRGGDVFDLAGAVNGTDDRTEQLETVAEWAGIGSDGPQGRGKPGHGAGVRTAPEKPAESTSGARRGTEEGREREREYIGMCRARMADGDMPGVRYLEERGFTDDEIAAAGIGYDARRHRVIVPWSTDPGEYYHIDRDITGTAAHKYEKPKADDVGPQPIHNPGALESDVVFVVEGIMDALAVKVCGHEAMALCGTGYAQTVKAMAERGYGGTVVAMLDNDDAGRSAQARMVAALVDAGIACREADSPALKDFEFKDAAEALEADRDALRAVLDGNAQRARDDAASAAEARYREAMRGMRAIDPAEAAMEIYGLTDYEEPTPTGIAGLDDVLDGGLRRGVYVLGAVSSLGKTTLAVQIADHVAEQGRGVLFVTIEQSARELVAKSLSRIIMQRSGKVVSTRALMSRAEREAWGPKGKGEMWFAFDAALTEYTADIAPRMRILEGTTQPKVADVAEVARAMAEHDGTPPVVFIDYLQLMAPQSDRDTDKQATDKNMMSLRQLARDMGTTAFVISSLNRSSYSGVVSLDSFKESGGIEYGADVLLGLQPYRMGERLKDVKDTQRKTEAAKLMKRNKAKDKRPSEIVVLKQRDGITPDDGVPVTFMPECNLFTDGVQDSVRVL